MGFTMAGLLFAGGRALLHAGLYGFTIFLIAPLFLGAIACWIVRPVSAPRAAALGALTVLGALGLLLKVGIEGLGCLIMALPLVVPLGAVGSGLVYLSLRNRLLPGSATVLLLLFPASLTWDTHARPPVYEVLTAIEINAPPEIVWKHVVTFKEIPEAREWYFRTGLAYPIRARIEGSGTGAVRYCEFSTGPFVEPIEVWDEPRLLRFRVTQNPAPMREWSPYAEVAPKHLDGYLVSKQGQFHLTRLAGNRTRVEGTTWYQHGLWPAEYWRWWSDAIIHRIHMRVLQHIRNVAEEDWSAMAGARTDYSYNSSE
jgi:hypothetical protein